MVVARFLRTYQIILNPICICRGSRVRVAWRNVAGIVAPVITVAFDASLLFNVTAVGFIVSLKPELAPPPKRILNQDEYAPSSFMGRVLDVTDKTVTIKPWGDIRITRERSLGDGRYEFVSLYRQDSTKPPNRLR